ncbi:pentatricopeptide repeat-containing protein At4g21300-like [Phragmites australis]|uniref:pentatricopeptide repeat-containing protein At4g21300-like n=1 Tax=Phragmites australis TaxID=29695 RepID=UPI002D791886|nr:pentatricopeptide repeat-containing protein At4g21300-like [Phragmites australis]XP_062215296.1 pentatricopeptide repeat-containing protein At4g21300-like [Phragmites australis]XP_062215297.1 pentatricopeptide repeat-containing protein At4g21300-like [Phragmites australis]XP_062215298.1 pentatricopeptide repeat-containing protein At4g21300-like [Phragmites australis]XP_062215299.1 pentatricopeptide repeat-containing protein At4g21300-like [Phragmites australis]XP_062215301.1 pentatricopepti
MGILPMILGDLARNVDANINKIAVLNPFRRLSGSIAGRNSGSSRLCGIDKLALLFQTCADVRSVKKLHARVFTLGLGRDAILGFKILNCYANLGFLPNTRFVFQGILNKDLAMWNSSMVDYFRAGYQEEVIILYKGLKLHKICMDGKTITFGLKSCTELQNLLLGKGMHADSLKLGLSGDKFVGSSLVGLYSKLGRMDDSQKAFGEILGKDIVAYTSMISGYSEVMDSISWNAFEIASDMLWNNLGVNRVTLVSLLQVAGNLGAIREGKSVHCYSIRRGIGVSDEILETSLVDMYTRCGAYQLASAVLNNSEGTVASWNAMLAGLARTGQSANAIICFSVMLHEHKVIPDSVTYANVLSACSELCYYGYAASVHAYLTRRYIPLDVVLATALIEVYSKCTRILRSRHLFDRLMVKDAVSYNTMIYGFLHHGMANDAITLFKEMIAESVSPNSVTVLSLLAAFADQRDFARGRWIHGFSIRHGFCSDVDIANQIIHMYSSCGKIAAASTVFDSLEKKNLVSWTAMMMGCLFCGHKDEVVRLCQLMQQHGEKLDSVTLITALQAVSEIGHLKGIKQIHGFVSRALLEKDTKITNSLMTSYAKCGKLDLSEALFFSLEHRDLDSWNTMISAYGMHGLYIKVLEMYKKMEEENIKPDELTFSSVLSACSHAGLVKEGWCIFQSMSLVYSVPPQEEHYGCIVDLLGRAGQLEEGYRFIKLSILKDKSSAFCALLSACRTHGNTILGQIIGKELLELEQQNPGTYALISEMYAQKGQWSESANLRTRAKESGLRKLPGSSLIETVEQAIK